MNPNVLILAVLAAQPPPPPNARVLSLEEAINTAIGHQPTLRQASAQTEALRARTDEAFSGAGTIAPGAGFLPQLNFTGSATRQTANYSTRPGALPSSFSGGNPEAPQGSPTPFKMYNYYAFQLQATQLIYDFGQLTNHWRSAAAAADAQAHTENATKLQVILNVRTAYFAARAAKDLVVVARETLENQQRHLKQTEGFVQVGTQPEIALAQSRTAVANARVQLITAENSYETGKVQLNTAMGIEGPTDYDVKDETLQAVPGEDKSADALMDEALSARPEFKAIQEQVHSQEYQLAAVRGSYWPVLSTSLTLTDAGTGGWGGSPALPPGVGIQYFDAPSYIPNQLNWNFNAQLLLTWPIFNGLLVPAEVREQRSLVEGLQAQSEGLRQQVRLALDQARLAVRAAVENLSAADEALINSRLQLKLAEGRYATGVGNIIELGDAQVAQTSAAAQRVQADFNLATARAQLLQALGRP